MIEADRITIRAGKREILSSVSLAIQPGRVTGIIGPNGAGKSTILKAISGEIALAGGTIRLDGADMTRMKARHVATRRAVLPQSSSLAFPFTVHEVVRLGVSGPRSMEAVRERVTAALARVDLKDYGGRFFQELSGGEQQRVHLARVLCQVWEPCPHGKPNYLFLDEPTASLDLRHQLLTLDTARDFARRGGGVVAILHDMNLAALYADHIIVVDKGRIAAEGPPRAVLTDAMLQAVFGVSIRVGQAPADQPFILPHSVFAA
ncbi:heme ABC transporter ATP-binding protein [Kaistia dalseonensis]|uniref:Iron complex transport system ATP-binding protein n=1 Tax=Kaistia dalseonensis TaxID=410840 RepID=A0ABU0H5Q7_9HYPH|nr:heme ABC transporter ATP-binding protein [Kaistia dalseonensis]MCX5495066.1 heme ABC transporter ATP-binding protein [Kaistia dalseonensis]MDQ0437648.1 iron complex transport system ATP-binding protein [Kaistia dalseonensis]